MFLGNGFSFESLRLAETGARYLAAANAIVGDPDERYAATSTGERRHLGQGDLLKGGVGR